MPVENIYAHGSISYNKVDPHSVMSETKFSFLGDILEDDEFTEDNLQLIKDKDKSMKPYWRYLSASQAKAKRSERAELEALAAELEGDDGVVTDEDRTVNVPETPEAPAEDVPEADVPRGKPATTPTKPKTDKE